MFECNPILSNENQIKKKKVSLFLRLASLSLPTKTKIASFNFYKRK